MELRDYIKLYWAQRWLIGSMMLVATAAAFIAAAVQPVRYAASEGFAVTRINAEATPDYQYDGYYALQAADIFSQTVVSWFDTASVVNDIYTEAKLDPEADSLSALTSRFHVKRYSAQNIVVRFTERTEKRAQAVAQAVSTVLKNRTASLNQDAAGKSLYEIIGSEAAIAPSRPNAWVYAGIALVLSFVFGVGVAAFRHYLR